jgi:hypothetical protein
MLYAIEVVDSRDPMCLLGRLLYVATRVIRLGVEKRKKSSIDLVIERSVELFGFTPDEKSDENLKWMQEKGYLSKKGKRSKRGNRYNGAFQRSI